jgi:hypothetical protein
MIKSLLFLGIVLLLAFSVSAGVTTYDGYGVESAGRSVDRDISCFTYGDRLVCPFDYDGYIQYETVYNYYDHYRYSDYDYKGYYYPYYGYRDYSYHDYGYYYNGELDVFGRFLERKIESSYYYTPSHSYLNYNNYGWDGRSSYNED